MSEALQEAMLEYGEAIRGDWNGFDGRRERAVIQHWVKEMRTPNPQHDLAWFRLTLGICQAGAGHWCGRWGYCEAKQGDHYDVYRCGCSCTADQL